MNTAFGFNPALAVLIVALIAVPVVTYRKTKDVKKTVLSVVAIIAAWYLLGILAHQFME